MNDNTTLIIGLFIVIFIITLIVYFVSDFKDKNIMNQPVVSKESKAYLIKVDYRFQTITFSNRNSTNGQDPRIVSNTFKIHDFIEALPLHQQKIFYDFIFKDCFNGNSKKKISINSSSLLKIEDHHWLRLNFKEKVSDDVVFIKGVQIYQRNITTNRKDFQYIANYNFKKRIEDLCDDDITMPIGTIFCFNCGKMENIQKRYSKEIANDYMMYMWDEINNIFANNGFVGHLRGDVFLAYRHGFTNKRDITNFANNIINEVDFNYEIDTYTFEIKPIISAIVVGEFGPDIEKSIGAAYQTTLKLKEEALGRRFRIYDSSLFNEFKQEEEYYDDLKNIMENSLFDPLYSPIVSMYDGQIFGYFSDMDFTKYSFASFSDALDKANSNEFGSDFFTKAVTKWFNAFLDKADSKYDKLFVFTSFDLLDNLINTYTSSQEYAKINLVAVITHYGDILKDPINAKQKVELAKKNGVTLGIVASYKMQTVLSQELYKFSYLILSKEMTQGVVKDQRRQLILSSIMDFLSSYNMQKIAIDIDNYQEAEVLKTMDVSYMSGNLFDPRKSSISMRKLAHLYDENLE